MNGFHDFQNDPLDENEDKIVEHGADVRRLCYRLGTLDALWWAMIILGLIAGVAALSYSFKGFPSSPQYIARPGNPL